MAFVPWPKRSQTRTGLDQLHRFHRSYHRVGRDFTVPPGQTSANWCVFQASNYVYYVTETMLVFERVALFVALEPHAKRRLRIVFLTLNLLAIGAMLTKTIDYRSTVEEDPSQEHDVNSHIRVESLTCSMPPWVWFLYSVCFTPPRLCLQVVVTSKNRITSLPRPRANDKPTSHWFCSCSSRDIQPLFQELAY